MYLGDVADIGVDFYRQTTSGEWVLSDPNSVDVTIYDSNDNVIHGPEQLTDEDNKVDKGVYEYEWVADQLGDFRFKFSADFPEAVTMYGMGAFGAGPSTTQTIEYYISVILPSDESTSGDVLGEDYELEFAATVDNVFGDVDHISEFYTDASAVHILDILYRLSKDVVDLKLENPAENPDVYEYVKLAALCELSRIYNPIMGGEETSLSLGDFSISTSRNSSGPVNYATASTWCEMAAVARDDLFGAKVQRFVKGGKQKSPIPDRKLDRAFYWRDDR